MTENVIELSTGVNIDKLIEFYNNLKINFKHLQWNFHQDLNVESGVGGHQLKGVYGWALQSNLNDLSKPCPPYNITKEEKSPYRDTAAMHGYILKIKERFPFAHQFSIAVHPKGTKINLHKDTDDFFKIHVPIITNSKSYFLFDLNKKYHFKADGKMILVNTSVLHGTCNEGESERAHLFFKIPKNKKLEVLEYPTETL